LKIQLIATDDRKKSVHITFTYSSFVKNYSNTYLSFHSQSNINKVEHWPFFKSKHSIYSQWLSQESYGITDDLNETHFIVCASNIILDIVTNSEPIVELIQA
jgi:hypothetical protein